MDGRPVWDGVEKRAAEGIREHRNKGPERPSISLSNEPYRSHREQKLRSDQYLNKAIRRWRNICRRISRANNEKSRFRFIGERERERESTIPTRRIAFPFR